MVITLKKYHCMNFIIAKNPKALVSVGSSHVKMRRNNAIFILRQVNANILFGI